MLEYHERWTTAKDLSEYFGYKIGESNRTTNQEYKADIIAAVDNDYNEKRAGEYDWGRIDKTRN